MPEEPAQSEGDQRDNKLLVVGLGASAGGIAALKQFFTHIPPSDGIAYAVILHLSPDYESRLSEVLQATTGLPVTQVRTRVQIQPNHVYVIAPNTSLAMSDGHITGTQVMDAEERRSPVDTFFRTLADSHGTHAVSVVLSGTGPNGSMGLKRIKEHGGLAIAQNPAQAEYGDMPRNAIATGLVDYVLPVQEIPGKILEYHERLRRVEREMPPVVRAETDDAAFREIITLLRVRTGHDFSNYKSSTIWRRIQRRAGIVDLPTLADYAVYMQRNRDEAQALMKELLISVTNFFRDTEAYAALEQQVIPRLFQGKRSQDQVRAWVAGCATGEEAYSIAMLLAEQSVGSERPRIQVFGSDLDERAIAVAREAYYTDAEVADISQERLDRFFQREAGGYRVRRELRELVLFAQHNVVRDPPFSHLDLLACRNLLIYLNRSIQERLLETFHFALNPGGFLFLGTSESPDGAGDLFITLDKEAHVYQSRAMASRLALPLGADLSIPSPMRPERSSAPAPIPERLLPIDLHHRLIEQYAPPSLLVSDEYALVHVSHHAGQYLEIGAGEPSHDVLQLILPELRLDLRTALHQAGRQRSNVNVHGVRITSSQPERAVDIAVRPVLRDGDPARGFFLIVIEDSSAPPAPGDGALQLTSPATDGRELEDELARVKAQLGATIEQYETQVEEAKASNEELLAANEELRSSAEELETSTEELQSVNEELTTVNQELKIKIEELRLTNNDFRNLINSTNIPTVFLDREMRVKLSTARAQDIFNLLPSDVGRRLSDITSKISDDGIIGDAGQVLERLNTVEREVRTRAGDAYLMRIQPYRTIDDRIEGVVLTFVDVTTLRQAEADVLASEERLRLLIDSAVDYAIFTMSTEGRIDSWNAGAERMFGYTADEIIGSSFSVLFRPEDRHAGVPDAELARARREGRHGDERFQRRKDGSTFFISGVTTRLGEDGAYGFAKISRDLTMPRQAADKLKVANDALEERVVERTAELHHEQEQVRGLLRRLVTSQEDQRARIARDLHDQFGQQLTVLRMTLERGQQAHARGLDGAEEFDRGLELTASINAELDFLAWELRPAALDDLGLAAALPRFVREWSRHSGIQAEFRLAGFESTQLSREQEVTYYRIAQEALNNVLKHAHATRVDVVLETRNGFVNLVVADNGVGFDLADRDVVDAGFGLVGIKERAALVGAALEIESNAGSGTTVYLRSPVDGERSPEPAA